MTAECIAVSDDMVAVVGRSTEMSLSCPQPALAFAFDLEQGSAFRCRNAASQEAGDLVLYVADVAVQKIFGFRHLDGDFHLPASLRQIAVTIRDCEFDGIERTTFRLAKSIELLCEAIRLMKSGALVPLESAGLISPTLARRLSAARRFIDENWREKLTIENVARACGLNRNALTEGFRELFKMTVAEAIADRRLQIATTLLKTTDAPIASVGYHSGYLNNASFARAFGRRYGMSPTEYRASALAA